LLVKDADLYPASIITVTADVFHNGIHRTTIILHDAKRGDGWNADAKFWWKLMHIPFTDEIETLYGFLDVQIMVQYSIGGMVRECRNDNYRSSSKRNYRVYRASDPMPSLPGWHQGDAHTHSSYTEDQVEFGAPMAASIDLCRAMGQSFYCVTDHSYDLDDSIESYLKNDPDLPKWKLLQSETDALNANEKSFAVLRGEEVSCGNNRSRNVHLLLFGTRKFFHGSGDGAEHWFHTEPEHSIADVLREMDEHSVAYAGHPTERTPLLQKLLIRRGMWSHEDMEHERLSGLQILNGVRNSAFRNGMRAWTRLLLEGNRKFIAAGNDAHGNFNSFRQIGIPFFTIREWDHQLFGKMRTGVMAAECTEAAILDGLRHGRTFITNGPVVIASITNEHGASVGLGGTITCTDATLTVTGRSSAEFGTFTTVTVYGSTQHATTEFIAHTFLFKHTYEFVETIDLPFPPGSGYLRIEACTENGSGFDAEGFCYTNPIWFDIE
ncbi:MAG TPA: CehA/McbA family metallohydrolase, partial [Bacteroidota bacterium]|nr:CehA/McbA family metallohydrolase [Bacteroidota bacterium]